jgi:hypothetical protein
MQGLRPRHKVAPNTVYQEWGYTDLVISKGECLMDFDYITYKLAATAFFGSLVCLFAFAVVLYEPSSNED